MSKELLEKAAREIGYMRLVDFNDTTYQLVAITPATPPLKAYWWRGKSAHIVAADVDGNFFLRHCDGSVRYWSHSKQEDIIAFKSVKEFTAAIKEDINDEFVRANRNT